MAALANAGPVSGDSGVDSRAELGGPAAKTGTVIADPRINAAAEFSVPVSVADGSLGGVRATSVATAGTEVEVVLAEAIAVPRTEAISAKFVPFFAATVASSERATAPAGEFFGRKPAGTVRASVVSTVGSSSVSTTTSAVGGLESDGCCDSEFTEHTLLWMLIVVYLFF